MSTDKSISIRQALATEQLVASLATIEAQLAELKADVAIIKAALSKPESKLESVSRQVGRR